MNQLNALELAVMQKLLDGAHPVLVALRSQFANSTSSQRKLSGVGFFIEFKVSPEILSLPAGSANLELGDVIAKIEGLQHGAGFLLFVRNGYLTMLEGYSYDEPWPKSTDAFELSYAKEIGTPFSGFSR